MGIRKGSRLRVIGTIQLPCSKDGLEEFPVDLSQLFQVGWLGLFDGLLDQGVDGGAGWIDQFVLRRKVSSSNGRDPGKHDGLGLGPPSLNGGHPSLDGWGIQLTLPSDRLLLGCFFDH